MAFWYWFFVAPAFLLAILSLRGELARARYVKSRLSETTEYLPPASVIVPVKGADEGLRENLAALASLDYPDYELVIVARTAADIPPGVLPRKAKIVLAYGDDPDTGEKVQNLNAAVRAARKRSEVLAFADSDGRPNPRWLRALTAPLADTSVGASTGYRWFLPRPASFWGLMRSVWDAVPAGMLGPGNNGFAWGGAMAIRREAFLEARVPSFWRNTVSDDYALSAAVHAAGLSIAYAPGALTPCFESITCARLFVWMRRQMTITRVYNPRMWWPAFAAHIIYCGAMAASALACLDGNWIAAWALLAQLAPSLLKGWNRARLAQAALREQAAWFRRNGWIHAALVPLATWLWLIALASSACSNTIEWRGYRHTLKAPSL